MCININKYIKDYTLDDLLKESDIIKGKINELENNLRSESLYNIAELHYLKEMDNAIEKEIKLRG